jgi:ABC-type antimicrobial peptide transport system, permease component
MLMMAQRTRDFGLIKAAGCPNSLVGGYFMTELLTVTAVGCVLGTICGFIADFAAENVVFGGYYLGDWWYAPVVFVVFFVLALFFGLQPIFKAAKMTAAEALSPANYYGLVVTGKQKALSRSALTIRIASRSMVRRVSPIARVVVLLSVVFILLTVSVAGGVIAKDTTTSWVSRTENSNVVAVAYGGMGNQYEALLSKFTGTEVAGDFNYSSPSYAIPDGVEEKLAASPNVYSVENRLVLYQTVKEVANNTALGGQYVTFGGQRTGTSLVIGVEPQYMSADFVSKGRSLNQNSIKEAVIGDSLAQTMYYRDEKQGVNNADPLMESINANGMTFNVVGVCIDPINNGYVTYVPIEELMNATEAASPNLLLITLNDSTDHAAAVDNLRNTVKSIDSNLDVFDLKQPIDANNAFLGSTWQTIMFIPLLSVASAAICMVSYMMLSLDEQRQEFSVLRAVGAKHRLIVNIAAFESAIVLLGSFGVGLSFGVIITLMTLMANPIVTASTVATIVVWLLSALVIMFMLSLYPAVKLSKTGILQIGS